MENNFYFVEKIIGRKYKNGKYFYKVKWEGFDYENCTWEPLENLQNVLGMVNKYDKSHPKHSKIKGKTAFNLLSENSSSSVLSASSTTFIKSKRKNNNNTYDIDLEDKINYNPKFENNSNNNTNNYIHSFQNNKKYINNDEISNINTALEESDNTGTNEKFRTISNNNSNSSNNNLINENNSLNNQFEYIEYDGKKYPIYSYSKKFKKVVNLKKDNKDIIAVVEYYDRYKGRIYKRMSLNQLKILNPYILVDFLEKKINFI